MILNDLEWATGCLAINAFALAGRHLKDARSAGRVHPCKAAWLRQLPAQTERQGQGQGRQELHSQGPHGSTMLNYLGLALISYLGNNCNAP